MIGTTAKDLNNVDYKESTGGEFEHLPSGLYKVGITSIKYVDAYVDKNGKKHEPRLEAELDIADGEHQAFFEDAAAHTGFWGLKLFQGTTGKSLPFFKYFVKCLTDSGTGYKYSQDEQTMVGHEFCGNIEAYQKEASNGNVYWNYRLVSFHSLKEMANGKTDKGNPIKPCTDKPLEKNEERKKDSFSSNAFDASQTYDINDDDIQF